MPTSWQHSTEPAYLYAVAISFFPGYKDPQLAQQLQEEIYQYRFHTFA